MPYQITGERLTSLFRPRSVALVGASDKSVFSQIAYHNLVEFGFADHTYLVSRRGTQTHGQPTVTSCAQIGEPVDVAYLMVPQAGLLEALDDAAAAGIRNACVLSSGYAEAGEAAGTSASTALSTARGRGRLLGPFRPVVPASGRRMPCREVAQCPSSPRTRTHRCSCTSTRRPPT